MTTPAAAILGIDLGTTEVKVGLVGLDGRLLAMTRAVTVTSSGRLMRPPTDAPTPAQTRKLTALISWLYR